MLLLNKLNELEFATFLKEEISKEKMLMLDFAYIEPIINDWWENADKSRDFFIHKSELTCLILKGLNEEDIEAFKGLGLARTGVAAVCITNIFKNDSPKLSLLIHEALSELFHVTDIQYDYEEHKTLYLKHSAINYKDWGSGYGEITPHSDDLYESLNVDYLSLTTCRDRTKTATKCFFPKDILKDFTNNELYRLQNIKAEFKSGKNVNILVKRTRPILEFSEKYGFRFFLDFRVDNITGERMRAIDSEDQILLDKMRLSIETCDYKSSIPATGTFFIVANHKVLHARAQMGITLENAKEFSQSPSLMDTPRLLYRSKGPRREYFAI